MIKKSHSPRHISLLLACCFALAHAGLPAHAASGLPEPGITLYGNVVDGNGDLLTEGELTWTYTAQEGDTDIQVIVTTNLASYGDAPNVYSYSIHLPAVSSVEGLELPTNLLPALDESLAYLRTATLNGEFVTLTGGALETATFGAADRGSIERVDLLLGVNAPPAVPSDPTPAHGSTLIDLNGALGWGDCARAETFDLYFWLANSTKPLSPTHSNFTATTFQPPSALKPNSVYHWQVAAHNSIGSTPGPVWSFRTALAGDLQKLLEFLLGMRSLSFEEQAILDLNGDLAIDIADLVMGLNRSVYTGARPDPATAERQSLAALVPHTLAIGSGQMYRGQTANLTLPVQLNPNADGAAGVNFHVSADPGIVDLLGARALSLDPNLNLYSYSPYPGELNVVFFTSQDPPMLAASNPILLLDMAVTAPLVWDSTRLTLSAAAVSDELGISNPEVQRIDGWLRAVESLLPGAPSLSTLQDKGAGELGMTWSYGMASMPPVCMGLFYDVYESSWVRGGHNDSIWYPCYPQLMSATIPLAQSGAYFAWIGNFYSDGSLLLCDNPGVVMLSSGTPHKPINVTANDLGGLQAELQWKPDTYGSWLNWIIVVDLNTQQPIISTGPRGNSTWHWTAWGSPEFMAGSLNLTMPAPGDYRILLAGMGWDADTMGPFATIDITVTP